MSLLWLIGGCSHKRMSFPQSEKGKLAHVCCLDCGQEFEYDWQNMELGEEIYAKA